MTVEIESEIDLSLYECTKYSGLSSASLAARFQKVGFTVLPGAEIPLSTFIRALLNGANRDEALARKALAEAEAQERENRIANAELCYKDEVERGILERWILPVRQMCEAQASQLAAQLNPADPAAAHKILSDWWESNKSQLLESNSDK